MTETTRQSLARLLPVVLGVIVVGAWFADVQNSGPYVMRNLLPPAFIVVLCAAILRKNDGRWKFRDWRLPLATVGYAIPALGLSVYLHYAYAVNIDELFAGAERPAELFRFLPLYTSVAGGIGFAIGWIIGRNV